MTFRELKELLDGKMALVEGHEGGLEYFLMITDDDYVHWGPVDNIDAVCTGDISDRLDNTIFWKVLDVATERHVDVCQSKLGMARATSPVFCTCDFYTVVLRTGCQCGGK